MIIGAIASTDFLGFGGARELNPPPALLKEEGQGEGSFSSQLLGLATQGA
jgi:hypothetical protein